MALSFANFSPPAATADTMIYSATSAEDRKQPADMNYRFEPISVSVSVMESNKAELIIKANFASAVSSNTFLNYSSAQPLLRIKILNNLTTFKGDTGYLWLDAPNNVPYQGSTRIDAVSSIYADPERGPAGGRKNLSSCKPKTWMDAGVTSSWVAFSIDRNCANINDLFWVAGFMDSDIWASTFIYDSKYFPAEPFFLNMTSVARPPKMKDQIAGFSSIIPTQNLDNPVVNTTVFSSQGLPVTVISTTPNICKVALNNTSLQIQLLATGNCTLEAYADGTSTINPAPRVQQTFRVNPKVMVSQEIYWDEPSDVQVGDEDFDLYIYSSSKLPVTVTSQNTSVCQFRDPNNPSMVTIVGPGYCEISVFQAGNDKYYSKSGSASFYVNKAPVVKPSTTPTPRAPRTPAPQAEKKVFDKKATSEKQGDFNESEGAAKTNKKAIKKTTITCYKGVLTKKVEGTPPKCPTGWKLKK
ncbi:MAG: hypothetical protein RJA33_13 [Actinomycetota bacterium]|jgi:hypothetical protein